MESTAIDERRSKVNKVNPVFCGISLLVLTCGSGLTPAFGQTVSSLPAQPPPAASAQPPVPEPRAPSETNPPSADNPPDDPSVARSARRFRFGPEVGFYFPSSGKASDAFGSVFTNIGLGFGGVRAAKTQGEFFLDFNVITNRRHGSDLALFPLGIAYRRSFSANERATVNPYYGFGADVIGVHSQSERYGLLSRFRFGAGVSALTGLTISDSGYIQVRYNLMSEVRGFNLSGTGVSLGFRF